MLRINSRLLTEEIILMRGNQNHNSNIYKEPQLFQCPISYIKAKLELLTWINLIHPKFDT